VTFSPSSLTIGSSFLWSFGRLSLLYAESPKFRVVGDVSGVYTGVLRVACPRVRCHAPPEGYLFRNVLYVLYDKQDGGVRSDKAEDLGGKVQEC